MDSPWALFDGATPQIRSLSLGFASGERGNENFVLQSGETRVLYIANSYTSVDSAKIASLGFYSTEVRSDGLLLKRTKTTSLIRLDSSFKAIKKLSKKIFFKSLNSD